MKYGWGTCMHGPVQQWLRKLRVLELSLPWRLDSCIHYRLALLNYSVTIVTSCACVSKAFTLVQQQVSGTILMWSSMGQLCLAFFTASQKTLRKMAMWFFKVTYHNMQFWFHIHLYILTVIHQCIQQQLPTSCCPSSTVALQILKRRSTTSKQPVRLQTVMYKFPWHPFLCLLFVHRYCTTSDTAE